jgi:hypothetical protein
VPWLEKGERESISSDLRQGLDYGGGHLRLPGDAPDTQGSFLAVE